MKIIKWGTLSLQSHVVFCEGVDLNQYHVSLRLTKHFSSLNLSEQ